jgi:tripeptidyl-peptidase-1
MGPETGDPEVVCASNTGGVITSGGGFSTAVGTPSWQADTVKYYLDHNNPPAGFNRNGRGYPDISFVGVNYQVINGGVFYTVFGTSCTAPLTAAFVTLVNSARYESGLPPIGLINPLLYSVGYNNTIGVGNEFNATYNDVTSGSNACCSSSNPSSAVCCATGFNAVKGW